MGILLKPTDPMHPASIFFALDGRGHELIIDRLPVKLFLKPGLATALASATRFGWNVRSDCDRHFRLQTERRGALRRDRMLSCGYTSRTEGDVILEPTVPISFGPVRWMGLPATAVYDIMLLPSPRRRDYLEWTHNDPGSFCFESAGEGRGGIPQHRCRFLAATILRSACTHSGRRRPHRQPRTGPRRRRRSDKRARTADSVARHVRISSQDHRSR